MSTTRLVLTAAACAAAAALAGCGGGDDPPEPAAAPPTTAASTRSVDYELPQVGAIGLRQAFLTLTGRTDGKTTAVLDFYVPRDGDTRDDLYPIAIRAGSCSQPGDVQHDLGRQSSGTTVLVLDSTVDELADSIDDGLSTVAIMRPDGKAVAWCGP